MGSQDWDSGEAEYLAADEEMGDDIADMDMEDAQGEEEEEEV